jgi:hypothetical protein
MAVESDTPTDLHMISNLVKTDALVNLGYLLISWTEAIAKRPEPKPIELNYTDTISVKGATARIDPDGIQLN